MSLSFYREHGKRLLDLSLAVPGMLALLPVIAGVALLTRWRLGTPVLFQQLRPGQDDRLFKVYKFRTMTDRRDSKSELLPDAERLTRFGGFMRRFSLDELPQLFNILRGEMSFVGPRPLLPQYLPLYSAEQRRRHAVRPGITGLAQVNGRNATTWGDRFTDDLCYVNNVSLANDVSILVRTIRKVIASEGVSKAGHATMPLFRGSAEDSAPAGNLPTGS